MPNTGISLEFSTSFGQILTGKTIESSHTLIFPEYSPERM
jgi:hypothetical protein